MPYHTKRVCVFVGPLKPFVGEDAAGNSLRYEEDDLQKSMRAKGTHVTTVVNGNFASDRCRFDVMTICDSDEPTAPTNFLTGSMLNCEDTVLSRALGVLIERREAKQSVLKQLLDPSGPSVSLLLAGSGSGKSTFVAQLVQELRKSPHFECIAAVFIGAVEGSTHIFKVLHALCRELQAHVDDDDDDESVSMPDDMMGLQKKGELELCGIIHRASRSSAP
jgi:hypothetical protein